MRFYDLSAYGKMILDSIRITAYRTALARIIRPDQVVLDIGAGPGILTLHACQLGARLVHAIEPNDVIQVAREIIAANGFEDRVQFHQKMSTELELEELADVMVSDVRGVVPLYEQGIPSIVDARRRLLKPGGTSIPSKDTLWAAPIESQDVYRHYNEPWRTYDGGFSFEPARTRLINNHRKCNLKAEQFLAAPASWATLDYTIIENASVSASLTFVVSRNGTLHGFALWFDSELVEGVVFSNAPGQPECIYGQLFLPLPEPVPVAAGQLIQLELRASHINGDYIWRWATRVLDPTDKCLQQYDQSTFSSVARSPTQLQKMAATHRPRLNPDGLLQLRALELMRNGESLDRVAAQLLTEFPRRFPTADDALGYLGGLSACYSL